MFSDDWGGYPDAKFLSKLDPKLGELRARLRPKAYAIDRPVGGLTAEWARRTACLQGSRWRWELSMRTWAAWDPELHLASW
jgi:L-ribulokinase